MAINSTLKIIILETLTYYYAENRKIVEFLREHFRFFFSLKKKTGIFLWAEFTSKIGGYAAMRHRNIFLYVQ